MTSPTRVGDEMLASLIALAQILIAGAPARAVDYAGVDRRIVKKPVFRFAPMYALLLFGREARLRVWVVVDGDTVYLDRNGNGDLTDPGEGLPKDARSVEIADPDNRTRYVIGRLGLVDGTDFGERWLDLGTVEVKGPVSYRQFMRTTRLRASPREAAVTHFHGPLAVGPATEDFKPPADLALVTGDKPTDLKAFVGTILPLYDCCVAVFSHDGECRHTQSGGQHTPAFPRGIHPVVDIEFPPTTEGRARVQRRYALDHFC